MDWRFGYTLSLILALSNRISAQQNETIADRPAILPDDTNSTSSIGTGPSTECEAGIMIAYECFNDAIAIAKATACNWALVMPWLYQCVQDELRDCPAVTVLYFDSYLQKYNTTLNGDACTPLCEDQRTSIEKIVTCKNQYGDYKTLITKIRSYENLASDSGLCGQIEEITTCIEAAAAGCSALQQIEYEDAETDGSKAAREKCKSSMKLKLPTTQSPLPVDIKLTDGGTDLKATYQTSDEEEQEDVNDSAGDGENGDENVILIEDDTSETGTEPLGEVNGIPVVYLLLIGLAGLTALVLLSAGIAYCIKNKEALSERFNQPNKKNIDTNADRVSVNSAQDVDEFFRPSSRFYGNRGTGRVANVQNF